MKVIDQSFEFAAPVDPEQLLDTIERAYRICYLSEPNGNRDEFIKSKIGAGHESPLEHGSISVIVTTNRGVTHEIVRHRLASYCQESTRYCNYSKDRLGNQITFIRPVWCDESIIGEWDWDKWKKLEYDMAHNHKPENYELNWLHNCLSTESDYMHLISSGYTPQQARNVLNNSVAARIMITMNIREWRHFFKLRAIGTTGKPHPEMQQIATLIMNEFKKKIPALFDDLEV